MFDGSGEAQTVVFNMSIKNVRNYPNVETIIKEAAKQLGTEKPD